MAAMLIAAALPATGVARVRTLRVHAGFQLGQDVAVSAVGGNAVGSVEKSIAFRAQVDERRLQRRFDVDHAALVNIARLLAAAFAFHENFGQFAVFEDRDANFTGIRRVHQDDFAHRDLRHDVTVAIAIAVPVSIPIPVSIAARRIARASLLRRDGRSRGNLGRRRGRRQFGSNFDRRDGRNRGAVRSLRGAVEGRNRLRHRRVGALKATGAGGAGIYGKSLFLRRGRLRTAGRRSNCSTTRRLRRTETGLLCSGVFWKAIFPATPAATTASAALAVLLQSLRSLT